MLARLLPVCKPMSHAIQRPPKMPDTEQVAAAAWSGSDADEALRGITQTAHHCRRAERARHPECPRVLLSCPWSAPLVGGELEGHGVAVGGEDEAGDLERLAVLVEAGVQQLDHGDTGGNHQRFDLVGPRHPGGDVFAERPQAVTALLEPLADPAVPTSG